MYDKFKFIIYKQKFLHKSISQHFFLIMVTSCDTPTDKSLNRAMMRKNDVVYRFTGNIIEYLFLHL